MYSTFRVLDMATCAPSCGVPMTTLFVGSGVNPGGSLFYFRTEVNIWRQFFCIKSESYYNITVS